MKTSFCNNTAQLRPHELWAECKRESISYSTLGSGPIWLKSSYRRRSLLLITFGFSIAVLNVSANVCTSNYRYLHVRMWGELCRSGLTAVERFMTVCVCVCECWKWNMKLCGDHVCLLRSAPKRVNLTSPVYLCTTFLLFKTHSLICRSRTSNGCVVLRGVFSISIRVRTPSQHLSEQQQVVSRQRSLLWKWLKRRLSWN